MSLAVIQMVSQSDVLANLAQARRLLEEAAQGGAQLAVLPENFAAMGRRDTAAIGRAEALGEGRVVTISLDATISLTTRPAPKRATARRKGRSVMPAIGARKTGAPSVTPPSRIGSGCWGARRLSSVFCMFIIIALCLPECAAAVFSSRLGRSGAEKPHLLPIK